MIVTDLFICEEVIPPTSVDPRPSILNPQNVIAPLFLPTQMSFGLAVGFCDALSTDNIQIFVKSEDGTPLSSTPLLPMNPTIINDDVASELRGGFVTSQIRNVIIENTSFINIEVHSNGLLIFTRKYSVLKKPR